MIKSTSFVLLLISLISVCQGLYFHIAETERKCFIEEIPDETTVIGESKRNRFRRLPYYIVSSHS